MKEFVSAVFERGLVSRVIQCHVPYSCLQVLTPLRSVEFCAVHNSPVDQICKNINSAPPKGQYRHFTVTINVYFILDSVIIQ